jgi:N-dimethylarginine dimethylaminohydrolase
MASAPWNIRDEWSPLEVVMVGIGQGMGPAPTASETYDPKSLEHVVGGTYPTESDVAMELDGLTALLERYGVEVLRPVSIGTNQVFTRDIGLVIGDQFVLTHLVEERRPEQAGLRDVLAQCSPPALSVPEHVRLEGGDVLLIDGELWVGYSEEPDFSSFKTARTNVHALEWLETTFPSYKVRGFELKKSDTNAREGALHLDCCLFVAARGHALFHPGGLKSARDVAWIRARFGDKLFEIDEQEMFDMHSNLISINPDTLVVGKGFDRVRNQLLSWGYRVEEVPFRETSKMGGLLRCTTLPLRRSLSR